jgi:hypothetical protein
MNTLSALASVKIVRAAQANELGEAAGARDIKKMLDAQTTDIQRLKSMVMAASELATKLRKRTKASFAAADNARSDSVPAGGDPDEDYDTDLDTYRTKLELHDELVAALEDRLGKAENAFDGVKL